MMKNVLKKFLAAVLLTASLAYGAIYTEMVQQSVVMGDLLSKKDARMHAQTLAIHNVINARNNFVESEFTNMKINGIGLPKHTMTSISGGFAKSQLVEGSESIKDGIYSAKFIVSVDEDSINAKIKSILENKELKLKLESMQWQIQETRNSLLAANDKINKLQQEIANDKTMSLQEKEKRINTLISEQSSLVSALNNENVVVADMIALENKFIQEKNAKIAKEIEILKQSEIKADRMFESILTEFGIPLKYKDDWHSIYLLCNLKDIADTGKVTYSEYTLKSLVFLKEPFVAVWGNKYETHFGKMIEKMFDKSAFNTKRFEIITEPYKYKHNEYEHKHTRKEKDVVVCDGFTYHVYPRNTVTKEAKMLANSIVVSKNLFSRGNIRLYDAALREVYFPDILPNYPGTPEHKKWFHKINDKLYFFECCQPSD